MAIRFKNLNEFNRTLKIFGDNLVPEQHLRLQKRVALDLLSRIVFRTPVDTGRARGNWQVELGASNSRTVETEDKNGAPTVANGASTINGARPYGLISLFNNLDYIQFLENGSSQKAPTGMVSVSLAEVRSQFT